MLKNESNNSLLSVDTFPYLENNYYIQHDSYDFAKHSLVIGSSGSGKSKFLALLIERINKINRGKYKVVVIDPHDALKDDLQGISSSKVIDFQDISRSIDIFKNSITDINASVELMLSLFRTLISDGYNGRLERVLRYSVYLLMQKGDFSFLNLRKLLLDLDYRNGLISELKRVVPVSVSYFFLTDFNELKNQSYNEAIAPIIAFIDEMQMIPVFNSEEKLEGIKEVVENNFLSVFSLNRLKIGDKGTKTIAGILMQQLFLLGQERTSLEHLIVVVDEVSVIENSILQRFLAEMRKYNVSVILAGQYFSQISAELKEAILANTSNYYIFRVSKNDAMALKNNIEIKIVNSDKDEDKYKMLTDLKARECLVRISKNGYVYPAFKARTVDYITKPHLKVENKPINDSKDCLKKAF
ncbi:MAG: DUF87 domain-containing protein, partial [Bacilli bacterium]|nr:DUF87 domain-containing protein [Bacilli bacterium]